MRLMLTLKTGIKGQAQVKVVEENTAKIMKSGAILPFLHNEQPSYAHHRPYLYPIRYRDCPENCRQTGSAW